MEIKRTGQKETKIKYKEIKGIEKENRVEKKLYTLTTITKQCVR